MGETMKSATALKALSALLMLGLGACATTQERIDAGDHRVIGAGTTCR